MQSNKKQKFCTLPATHFFKPVAKAPSQPNTAAQNNDSLMSEAPAEVDYLAECPLFKSCEAGVRYDIGLVVGHINEISDAVKFQILTCRDYLPKDFRFPGNNDPSPRRCSFDLLDRYTFLRYSPSKDGVFCVYCLLFSSEITPKKFHLQPASDWSNIYRDCKAHSEPPKHQAGLKACPHLLCSQKAENFVSVFRGQQVDIAAQLDDHRKMQVEKNRHILVQILKLIHRLGKQNIAIRGKSDERSNFNVFLNAQAEHDTILAEHLRSAAFRKKITAKQVRGTYISHRVQEEFISVIGDYLEERVIARVKRAMFFSILLDECRDSAGKEQLSVFFRYVYKDPMTGKYSVHEDFTTFLHCERTSGEALFNKLMGGEDGGYIGRKGVPMENGRGLGSDGGGNMAGKNNGLQAHVRRAHPKMHFHWCDGHCLNLCIGKACDQPLVKKVVDHVQQVTIAFEYSPKREQFFKEAIAENQAESQDLGEKQKLKMLCATRWSARSGAFSTVKEGLFPLVRSLEKLEDENDEKANGLLTVILQFYFLVVLYILASALAVVNILSHKLQYETLDLNDAADSAKVCKAQLQNWLQEAQQPQPPLDTHFEKLYYDACQVANDLDVDEAWPRCMQRRPQDRANYANIKEYFLKTIYVPFLEEMLFQIDTRLVQSEPHFRATWLLPSKLEFNLSNNQIVQKILDGLFCQQSPYFEDLLEYGNHSAARIEIEHWVCRWRQKPEDERPKHVLACLNSVNVELYPNITIILVHFLTLPVTTCSVERSFSEMRRLKTWLRSTMTDSRLSALALMHFNYEIEIPYEELIKKWSQFKTRLITLDVNEWIANEEAIF